MFYQPYKPRRRRPRGGCLATLVKLCLLAAAVCLCVAVFSGVDIGGLTSGYTNILLMGVDGISESGVRADTMIIASVSTSGSVKLTSLMRDTLVGVEGHGASKLNSAYAYGGSSLAVKTVSDSFSVDIDRYAVVDFKGFADIIDELGGVRLSVTQAEMEAMNRKKGHKLESYGDNVLLDGVQALRYVRIRKIDSDYQRASRQRKLLGAVLKSLREVKDPVKLVSVAMKALPSVKTDMNPVAIALTAFKALKSDAPIEQLRIPAEGTYESGMLNGVWSIRADLTENARLIRQFVYGK